MRIDPTRAKGPVTLIAGVGAVVLSVLGLAPATTASTGTDQLQPGDVLSLGRVELTVPRVGQHILRVADLHLHTEATTRPQEPRLCITSNLGGESVRYCSSSAVDAGDFWDLRLDKTMLIGYDAVVSYRYVDGTSGDVVSGQRTLGFPSARVQSPPLVNAQLYARGNRNVDEPIVICERENLRLRGTLSTWDVAQSTADFDRTPYQIQFRALHTERWVAVKRNVLDGSDRRKPSLGSLVPSDRTFLIVHPETTGRWRIYRPALDIDGFTFPETSDALGLAKVVACI